MFCYKWIKVMSISVVGSICEHVFVWEAFCQIGPKIALFTIPFFQTWSKPTCTCFCVDQAVNASLCCLETCLSKVDAKRNALLKNDFKYVHRFKVGVQKIFLHALLLYLLEFVFLQELMFETCYLECII